MSLGSMRNELLGIPGINFGLATTKIGEAFEAIQNENIWSFQLQVGGWLTPGLLGGPTTSFLSPGLMTVTPGTNIVTGDVFASQAWQATISNLPLLTQQQFRVPYYSLYNVIALGDNGTVLYVNTISPGEGQKSGTYAVPVEDAAGQGSGGMVEIVVGSEGTVTTPVTVLAPGTGYVTPVINFTEAYQFLGFGQGGFGEAGYGGGPSTAATFFVGLQAVLTLDRLWMEPPQINAGYMIYQAYFAAPPGFKRWYYLLDTTNNYWLNWWSFTQINLSEVDAQRVNFLQPTNVVPWGPDTRQGSATFGQMLYELWPHPIMQLPYTFGCQADWPALQNPSDTIPFPLTDELVKMRSYEMLYLWKESQRGDEMERGSGANWQFLTQAMRAEYNDRLKRIRVMDRNLVDMYFTKMRRMPASAQVWGTVGGQASVGDWNS